MKCSHQGINRKHGESGYHLTPEYRAWRGMITRCSNPNRHNADRYVGRGIRVCRRWRISFSAFLCDVGRRPSPHHSLDRKNPDGHYTPANVRWATAHEQRVNRSRAQ